MFFRAKIQWFLLVLDGHESYLDHAEDMLEPDLRPVRPQPNSPESMQIYTEHRLVGILLAIWSILDRFTIDLFLAFQMAADFLEVQKQIENVKNYKRELEEQLKQSEKQMEEVAAKSDNEEAKKFVQLQKEKVKLVPND